MRYVMLVAVMLATGCGAPLDHPADDGQDRALAPCHNNDDCRFMHGRCVYPSCNGGPGHCVSVTAGDLECGGSMRACCVDSAGVEFCQAGHYCVNGICDGCYH